MKLITSNFITCAVKACRGTAEAYPLRFSGVELESTELEFDARFICNIMPRIEWPALVDVCRQLGNDTLPPEKPEDLDPQNPEHEQVLRSLHNVLLQTSVKEGDMTCGRCGHVYKVRNGVANMLLHESEV